MDEGIREWVLCGYQKIFIVIENDLIVRKWMQLLENGCAIRKKLDYSYEKIGYIIVMMIDST